MASCLNIEDIESWEYVDINEVYDIAVEDNHNYYLYNNESNILVHNSSKTYSLQQLWVEKSFIEPNKRILVTRKTFPALRLSAYQDFKDVLTEYELWNYFGHNKSNHVFTNKQTGTEIHFISSDNPQKVRGVKWDYIQMSEGNELDFETFRQFIMRTPGKIFIDFNPDDEFTWINTEVEQVRNDFALVKSSYQDNPFLPEEIIKEIEYLKDTDQSYWQIFGLGEYGTLKHKIYDNYEIVTPEEYDNAPIADIFKGLDFGYVNPMALVECKHYDGTVWLREKYYQSYKKIDDLLKFLEDERQPHNQPIYCDSADPAKIQSLTNYGYNALKSDKRVKEGIDHVRRFKLKICSTSSNLIKEIRNYKYQEDKDGQVIEEPVKFQDHCMDGMKYGIFTHLQHVFYG